MRPWVFNSRRRLRSARIVPIHRPFLDARAFVPPSPLPGALRDHVPPDQVANLLARDRVENVLLLRGVRRDAHAVLPDAEDQGGGAPLVVKTHLVPLRFRTRISRSSHAFSIRSRFRVPTPWAMRTAWRAGSIPSISPRLWTRTSANPLGG